MADTVDGKGYDTEKEVDGKGEKEVDDNRHKVFSKCQEVDGKRQKVNEKRQKV